MIFADVIIDISVKSLDKIIFNEYETAIIINIPKKHTII